MKNIIKIALVMAMGSMLSGCFFGEKVQVPPAFEGKVLTQNGYLPEAYPPSTFRLANCWTMFGGVCDELVLIEKSDTGIKESFTVFMPRNQLEMTFDLRMTASIVDGKTDAILARVKTSLVDGRKTVTFEQVYNTYAKPIIRDAVRAVVAKYTIDEVASSRDAVNEKIRERLTKVLANTPIGFKTAGLGKVNYPAIILKKKEEAENRRIEIEQEAATKQIMLIKLQTKLEAAKASRAIRREKAQAAAEENEIAAKSITEKYLQYKRLEVLHELAKSGATTFVPFEALGTVGLSNKVLNR